MDVLTEIKAKLSIEDLVSSYIKLKKAGRNYKGLCPFHNEKTPSFMVSTEKQIAYCFGCHQGGDIFKFTQVIENLDFPETVKLLAEKVGVEVKSENFAKSAVRKEEKAQLKDVLELANGLYFKNLFDNSNASNKVLEYLKSRGIDEKTIKIFKIGFAKDGYLNLYNYLVKEKSINVDLLYKDGLLVSKDTQMKSFRDKFYLRLMFPFFDNQGKVVGYSSRALKAGQQPKYLNSPDTPLFNKSRIMYGFYQARKHIKDENEVVVVEGNFDVLASHFAGVKNVIAVSGTALTEEHLQQLKRISNTVVLAFDSDKAGKMALKKALKLSLAMNMIVKVVDIKEGSDPAEIVKENPDNWKELVKNSKYFMDYFFDTLLPLYNEEDILNKKSILNEILYLLKINNNSIEKDLYVQKAASSINTQPKLMYHELSNFRLDDFESFGKSFTPVKKDNFSISDYILGLFLYKIDFFENYKDKITDLGINTKFNTSFSDFLFKDINEMSDAEKIYKDLLLLWVESKCGQFSIDLYEAEIKKMLLKYQKDEFVQKQSILLNKIKDAKSQKDENKYNELLREFQMLTARR